MTAAQRVSRSGEMRNMYIVEARRAANCSASDCRAIRPIYIDFERCGFEP